MRRRSRNRPGRTPRSRALPAADRIAVLIIDGVNNHDWESTTAAIRATLEQTGRFAVDVSTSPGRNAPREDWEVWRPAFSDYAVVVSNFNSDCERDEGNCEPYWSADLRADFEAFVRERGGFVAVHAADNHAADELYASLRGPAGNVEVLAHAFSRVTQEPEPMLMIVTYGEGRVFHIPMGHYNDEFQPFGASLHCVGFQTVLARGAEYVATGEVTIGVPAAFPGSGEPSVVAPERLEWPM